MAENQGSEITAATLPNHRDWWHWTIEQAVQAITGDSVDLTKLIDKKWFTFVPEAVGGKWDSGSKNPGEMTYHAYGKQYYGVNIDHAAVTTWQDGYDKFVKMGPGLAKGVAGEMDASTLETLGDKIVELQQFLDDRGSQYRQWAKLLDSNAADFDGKAAAVIQSRMDNHADNLEHWARQVRYNKGQPLVDAVNEAVLALNTFNSSASDGIDFMEKNKIRDIVQNAINSKIAEISDWLGYWGLLKSDPPYDFVEPTDVDDLLKIATGQGTGGKSTPLLSSTKNGGFLKETVNRIMEQARLWYMAAGGTDDGWVAIGELKAKEWADWYIGQVVGHFRGNLDLRDPNTWDKLNKEVTAAVQTALFGADIYTHWAIGQVHDKYQILERALHGLDPAKPPHTSQFGPGGTNGSLFPPNLFDGMFPPNLFDGMFPDNLFDGVFPDNLFDGMFPENMFDGVFPENMFDGTFPENMFDGLFPDNMFPEGGPNGYGGPYGNLPGYPDVDGFGGNPYSAYQNMPPYPEQSNYGGSPYGSPYGNTPGYPNVDGFGGNPYSAYQNMPPYPEQSNYGGSPYGNYALPEFGTGPYAPGQGLGYGNYNYNPADFGMGNYPPGQGPYGQSPYGNYNPADFGLGNYAPGDYGPGQVPGDGTSGVPGTPSFSGADIGPHGEVLGPDGKPQLGPHRELMGPDNQPVLGPYGQILGPDGNSLLGPNGELLGPDGGSLLGPQGQILGPDGQLLLGPSGELRGPDGGSLLGPQGQILGPDGQSLLGPNGELVGPDGQPVLGTDGKPILGTPPAFDPGQFQPGGGGSFDPGQYVPGGAGSFDPGQFQPGGLPGGGSLDPGGAFLPGGPGGLGPGSTSYDPGQFLEPGPTNPATYDPPQSRLDLPLDIYKSALEPPAYQTGSGVQLDSNGLAIPPGAESGYGGPAGALPVGQSGSPSSAGGPGMAGTGGMMPFMPPMGGPMGGMGGPGGNKEERERQTWLSEDEEVWGTNVPVGAGVIGRPDEDEEEFDPDELVLPAGPVRTRRPGTPVPARAGAETGKDSEEAGGEDRRDDAETQRS